MWSCTNDIPTVLRISSFLILSSFVLLQRFSGIADPNSSYFIKKPDILNNVYYIIYNTHRLEISGGSRHVTSYRPENAAVSWSLCFAFFPSWTARMVEPWIICPQKGSLFTVVELCPGAKTLLHISLHTSYREHNQQPTPQIEPPLKYTALRCHLKFDSWTYDGSSVNLTKLNDKIDMNAFGDNDMYDVYNNDMIRNVMTNDCCPGPYIDITASFDMKRGTATAWFHLYRGTMKTTAERRLEYLHKHSTWIILTKIVNLSAVSICFFFFFYINQSI